MGLSHLNIWLRDINCTPLKTCWRTDLVIKTCGNQYLVDFYPEILTQLSDRYGTSGFVSDVTSYPITDQTGLTEFVTIGTGSQQTVTFASPATTPHQIASQMDNQLTDCSVSVVDGQVRIITDKKDHKQTISVGGGTCGLLWGSAVAGTGYEILKLDNYQNATRISIRPKSGEFINHIECFVPPGCYKIWSRCCFGNNEETNKVMTVIESGEHRQIDLLLDAVRTCSENIIHPAMDLVVNDGKFQDIEYDIVPFIKQMIWLSGKNKAVMLNQLDERIIEAQQKVDTTLESRLNAVRAIVNSLPADC